VHIHGGNEYEPSPEPWKQQFFKELVDAGADIVQGHHPHVWQGIELYRDKYIYYSLGNFIFDQSWSAPTSQSYAIRLTLTKTAIIKEEVQPYIIRNNSRPEPVEKLTAYPFRKRDIL
jgi:poly-gamma-glutamate synthesis protein (capsule biosynthesis protein)